MIKVKLTVMAEPELVDEIIDLIKMASKEKIMTWAEMSLKEMLT